MIKVAAAALNQIPLDWEHNKNNILRAIMAAREEQVSILCCPELCITGYGCEDWFLSHSVQSMAFTIVQEIANATKGMIVSVGLPLLFQEKLYNTACLLVDGQIAGFVAKQNLPRDGVYYEPRWFTPWPKSVIAQWGSGKEQYPIGDIVFDFSHFRLGFEICEDAWVINRTGLGLAERNVDIILNPSASHFTLGKTKRRKRFIIEGARGFKIGYIYANLLGNEAGRLIYDGDTYIAANEVLLAQGPRFSYQDCVLTHAWLDIETLKKERSQNAKFYEADTTTAYQLGVIHITAVNFLKNLNPKMDRNKIQKNLPENFSLEIPAWENSPHLREEEFSRALALSLFDYMRKSRTKGYVLNLSGGADSSSCACLVYLMLVFSLRELGETGFREKLAYIFENNKKLDNGKENSKDKNNNKKEFTAKTLITEFLYCLYQRSENNTDATWQAALTLSEALGVSLTCIPIDKQIQNYEEMVTEIIQRSLDWSKDDFALQNIQARVRSPSIWLLANIRDAIPICPSNRSEASVGYTTMDGDSSGGISPIAGISKSFLLTWLKWLETEGPIECGPIPALKGVTSLSPSAELRPQSSHQTDEDDLMPYHYLDEIEDLFVREKKSPLEILKLLYKHEKEELKNLAKALDRFVKLWCHHQWKRERLAPTFHVDEESVDPKTWCRFPILSGGFHKELQEMWDWVDKQ